MEYLIYRITDFEIIAPFTIKIHFDDGSAQSVYFEPVLGGELFRPLRDQLLFNQVRLDPEAKTLVWPNGADFDPAILHDWPNFAKAFAARAWEAVGEGR